MPKVKTKSLGEQLFEIVEAESDENRPYPGWKPAQWSKQKARKRRRFQAIAARFAERIQQTAPTSSPSR